MAESRTEQQMTAQEMGAQDPAGRPPVRRARIGIVGAGFAGLGLAIRLKQTGVDDFVVWEREAEVGGTWWVNTYPGCQCDIPSHLYSFSFAPNPAWSRTYPKQPELRDYLRTCSHRFGVRDNIRLGCRVEQATWREEHNHWLVETTQGPYEVEILVGAPGPLSEPSFPDVAGLDTFEGTLFHTARWDHEHDLRGKRVGVVGTGATAIQVVPEIQPLVEHLTVFQRTPPWVVPHTDRNITRVEKVLYRRLPILQRLVRASVYWAREMLVPGLVYQPRLLKIAQRVARRHLEKQVPDPELRARLTPDYTIGCKRILPSNNWYPAITQPNVEVEDAGVTEVRPNGVVTARGEVKEVDTLIFATGFYVTDIPFARKVHGGNGRTLAEFWAGSPQAYRGTAIPGFPNLFLLVGPNVGLGHNSIVFMIEAQIHYLLEALKHMESEGAARIEVRREVYDRHNRTVQKRLRRTVWNTGGCSSWYIDANGKNTTIWPDFTWRFWRETRTFDPAAWSIAPRTSKEEDDEERRPAAGMLADHYRGGRGEPLLLVHGYGATWRAWGRVPELLSADFDVAAVTLPGHTGGASLTGPPRVEVLVDAVEAMLDELGWDRPHIAGFSLGGWLALELAKRGRAITLTAVAPGGADIDDREARRVARMFLNGRSAARLVSRRLPHLARSPHFRRLALRNQMVSADRMTPQEVTDMIRSHIATPVFDDLLVEMGISRGLRDLDRINVPVHIVWGEKDRVLPLARHAEFFRNALPHATFEIIPDAGHVAFWDAPEAVADAVRHCVARRPDTAPEPRRSATAG